MAFVKAKIKMRPSILMSALIYTQLRLKIKKKILPPPSRDPEQLSCTNIGRELNLFVYIPRWPHIANAFPVFISVHQQSFVLFMPGPRVSHFIPTRSRQEDEFKSLTYRPVCLQENQRSDRCSITDTCNMIRLGSNITK